MNGTVVKNKLIFDFATGSLGPSKSIFTSTYLFLNSKASSINYTFEQLLGDDLFSNDDAKISNLKYNDCLSKPDEQKEEDSNTLSPISKLVGPLNDIDWKQVYKGFSEFILNIKGKLLVFVRN